MNARSLSRTVLAGSFALAFALAITPGSAHALSCDGHLVELGDSEAYVRSVCGEPTAVSSRTELRSVYGYAQVYGYPYGSPYGYGAMASVQVDVLVYDFGPTRFIDELTFESGVLRIDRIAGYGTVRAAHIRREARRADRAARTDD